MPINTNLDPNLASQIWRMPDFPQGQDSIGSFFSGYLGAKKTAPSNEKPQLDASGNPVEIKKQGPSYFQRLAQGYVNSPGVQREGQFSQSERLTQAAQLQGLQLSNRAKELELAGTVSDQQAFGSFMENLHKDPDFLSNPANMPIFKTPKYQALGMGMQRLYNQSVAAKTDLKIQSGFYSDMAKLANVGTPESAAAYKKIRGMVDSTGNPTDDAILELGSALKQFNQTERPVIDLESLPGKALVYVPGSKSFQVKDLDGLDDVRKLRLQDALTRRRQTQSRIGSTTYILNQNQLKSELGGIEDEINALLEDAAGSTDPNSNPVQEPPNKDPLGLFGE